jgi:hypothetical protein
MGDTLIPFIKSHILNNNSPIKQGIKTAGYIVFTKDGKRNQVMLLIP